MLTEAVCAGQRATRVSAGAGPCRPMPDSSAPSRSHDLDARPTRGCPASSDLLAVLDGRRADDGRSLPWLRREVRLPGFDLTFSAPKGVSLLFALADDRTSLLVQMLTTGPVAGARGCLEREAGEVPRGRDGVNGLPGGGFVAAAFRYRTSRAGDPQLHTHVLVANMTRHGPAGRWSALDGRQPSWQAKTARHAVSDRAAPRTARTGSRRRPGSPRARCPARGLRRLKRPRTEC